MPKMKIYWSRIIGVAVGVLALTGWSGFVVGRNWNKLRLMFEDSSGVKCHCSANWRMLVLEGQLTRANWQVESLKDEIKRLKSEAKTRQRDEFFKNSFMHTGLTQPTSENSDNSQQEPSDEACYEAALQIIRGRVVSDYEKARTLLSDINVDSEKYNDAQAYLKWLQVDQLVRDASAFAEEDDHESAVELMKVARELDGGDKAGADVKRLLKKFTSERDMSCGSASTLESDQATAKNKPIKDSHAMSQATKDALIKSSGISLEEAQRRLRVK